MRTPLAAIPLAAVILMSSGAGAAPNHRQALRSAPVGMTLASLAVPPKRITYVLRSARYPRGYKPRCGAALNVYAVEGAAVVTGVFTFAGGIPVTIYVGPCHARAGDSMSATLTDVYGHVVFVSHPSPGNFTIKDTGVDSQATLVIKDNTTGHSVTRSVWFAY